MYPSVKADLPFRGAPRRPIPINYSIALIMKSCGFTLMGIVWTAFVASAQGTISINMASGTKPRVLLNGINVVAADNIWLEVLVAGAAGLSGGAAEPFHISIGGAGAGLISKGTLTVNGLPGGATAAVTILAWDKDTGADFDRATVRASSTFSLVLGGVVDANGIAGLPTSIVPAFTGLDLKSIFLFERRPQNQLRFSSPMPSGFSLQVREVIDGPWRPVDTAPGVEGDLSVVEVPADRGSGFYRWVRP